MTEGNADALNHRRLTQEITMLRQQKEELTQENVSLKQRLKTSIQQKEKLRQENRRLGEDIWDFAKDLHQEKRQIIDLSHQVERLYGRIKKLVEESETRILELQSQMKASKSRVCSDDCTCCIIANICENEEQGDKVKLCCPQLRTIISLHAGPKFEPKHHICANFMDLLIKCGIVKEYCYYKYPPQMPGRENEMAKAFDELMKMDPSLRAVIIGRIKAGIGHTELCYLNTRTQDGKITIHNPQTQECGEGGRLQDFIDHVRNDEGVIFYNVIIEELKKIYDKYSLLFHRNTYDQTLATATGDVDGDR